MLQYYKPIIQFLWNLWGVNEVLKGGVWWTPSSLPVVLTIPNKIKLTITYWVLVSVSVVEGLRPTLASTRSAQG